MKIPFDVRKKTVVWLPCNHLGNSDYACDKASYCQQLTVRRIGTSFTGNLM